MHMSMYPSPPLDVVGGGRGVEGGGVWEVGGKPPIPYGGRGGAWTRDTGPYIYLYILGIDMENNGFL